MKPTRGALKWILPAGAGTFAFLISWFVLRIFIIDQQMDDWIIRLRGPLAPHPDILLITADRGSLNRLGPWPFAGDDQLKLLEKLSKAGAKCVIYTDPPYFIGEQPVDLLRWTRLNEGCGVYFGVGVSVDPFAEEPISIVQELTGPDRDKFQVGVSYLEPDTDGVVRRMPIQLHLKGMTYPTLPVAVADRLGAPALSQGVLSDGYIRIPFVGPSRSFPSFSCWRVLADDVPAEFIRDRICLVGVTDSMSIATRSTPTSQSPLFMAPVEIHANALDAILNDRYYKDVPIPLMILLGVLVAVGLSLLFAVMKPSHSLGLLALYLLLLLPAAVWLAKLSPILVPIVPLALLATVSCMASLGLQLVGVQDDLLELLTVSHEISWIFSEAEKAPDGSGEQVSALVHLAKQVLKADRVALALPLAAVPEGARTSETEVRIAGLAGVPKDDVSGLAVGAKLRLASAKRLSTVEGPQLAEGLKGSWWQVRLDHEHVTVGWLLVLLSREAHLQSSEQMVGSLAEHLSNFCADLQGRGKKPKWRDLWELPILRVFSSGYVARVLSKLSSLEVRNRSERRVLTRMLDDQEVGLVLADGLGRVRLVNKFFREVATAGGVQWGGGNAFELLSMLTQKPLEDLAIPLGNAFAEDLPTTFPIKLEAGLRQSFLVTATPLRSNLMASVNPQAALQAWPDHFMILLADVTALQQVDAMKTELLEAISFKARNHLAALIGYGDLIVSAPEMAAELSGELKAEAEQLTEIFQSFQEAAAFSLDHKERKQRVPINMNRMAKEVIENVSELARQMQVEIKHETEQIVNLVLAEEQGLRTALVSILYTCLSSCRMGGVISLKVSELENDLLITIQGKGCILSPRMMKRLLVSTETEQPEEDVQMGSMSRVPKMVEREGIKWLSKARSLIEENKGFIEIGKVGGMGAEFKVRLPKIA